MKLIFPSTRLPRLLSLAVLVILVCALLLRLPGRRVQAAYSFAPGAAYFNAVDPKGLGKPLGSAAAMDTAFTYQGQLRQDGQAVNGACDFEFRLWDAASDGAQVGSTAGVNALPVSGGLFNASLDFGAGAFDGQARWLEVSTRCPAGSGSFTSLGRQALAPAPYALYAAEAGHSAEAAHAVAADSATEAAHAAAADNAANAANSAALDGQPGSFYQARVSGACAVGTTIQAINADGTVQCQPAVPVFARTAVDSIGDVGGSTSIAIGGDGLGLVSYRDNTNGDLKVAHCSDAACSSASLYTLDSAGNVGEYTSIAIGGDGLGLISYYDFTNGDLKVAHCSDAACSSASLYTLDSAGTVGYYISIAIGGDGLGLVSYRDSTNGDLKVAHCDDNACAP